MSTPRKTRAIEIGSWLNDLAALTAGTTPLADSEAKIAAMTKLLMEQLPAEAFSKQSLYEMSRRFKFFPSHAELSEALGVWWREHNPNKPEPLPGADDPSLREIDRVLIKFFFRDREAGFPDAPANVASNGRQAHRLSWMRLHCEHAYNYIVKTDIDAREIARQRGWYVDASDAELMKDPNHVTRCVAQATALLPNGQPNVFSRVLLSMLRTMVRRDAPENLHLVPGDEEARRSEAEARMSDAERAALIEQWSADFERRQGRKIGELSPDQLREARKAAGIVGLPDPAPAKPPDADLPWRS